MNRLAQATSPYLQQHRDNPVAWWEWSPQALAEAVRLNRPILLSIGYSACHWCHVMAHESFEDPDVAAVMNALFINIKVDREERPDVDHIYMGALQAMGERGGWPLTMFLTPQAEPFWGGTYFPKEPRLGRPGFVDLLRAVAHTFESQPERIAGNRAALLNGLAGSAGHAPAPAMTAHDLESVGARLAGVFDPRNGGIGGAPKFPNPTVLEFAARHARRADDGMLRELVHLTLERMAKGGMHDHLGGGFARYSTDERWLVPHFEKMLYDNAQLIDLYALMAVETGSPLARSVAEGIVSWLTREMLTPEGAFASSLDADSEGEEGKFYVWDPAEIRAVLSPDDAALFARMYDITDGGNFEGKSIPNRLDAPETDTGTEARLERLRATLLARRELRARPSRDDKVLADWNGLMIAGLVRAGLLLDRPDWVSLAATAFSANVSLLGRDGRLGHAARAGSLVYPGFALDHATMMRAALALFEATGEQTYLEHARRWCDVLLREYRVPETGLLAMTSSKTPEPLITRPQPVQDDAVPNANGVFADALVRLAALTHDETARREAETLLERLSGPTRVSPLAHCSVLNAVDQHLRATSIIVGSEAAELLETARRLAYLDRSVASATAWDRVVADWKNEAALDLGARSALICAGMQCSLPVSDSVALLAAQRDALGSHT
ncbi:thioredoxin domain-containing protein [Methylobacterium durans]|uniref:Thioredoxin domain-containing protein n=1 Tax=Methylobacterium durans TaxID=2202825 RepID=A0A2U8W218_9HYPH|nr:thioredoxin domain-containing protein [Methylobacterium durans]AWN40119.1 thioredoxin domain-containing protein [Methylobacterium durans]